jgi:competence protein ComFC
VAERIDREQGFWKRFGGLVLEALFPGRCLNCGTWLLLESGHRLPLCADCAALLLPLAGRRCCRCGIELISELGVCVRCRNADYAFESSVSLFAYRGAAQRLLAGLKFDGRSRVAPFFAEKVADVLKERRFGTHVLVPVPPRPGRKSPDAAELVSRALGRTHGIAVLRPLLRTGSVQQKSLDYEQRRKNLKGKIRIDPRRAFPPGLPVVLLDDVFTTGATLDACARVLLQVGCARVNAVTLVMEE